MASEDEELFVSMKEVGETDMFTDHHVAVLSKFISIADTKKRFHFLKQDGRYSLN